jgi:riboflavin biosynthesis pyrimidine reductase
VGLLRALADCVLIGAGTLRADAGHRWTPAAIHPVSAERYASLGRADPQLIVVSGSGRIDPAEPALRGDHLVLTDDGAAARLQDAGVNARTLGEPPFSAHAIVDAVRKQGHGRVLVEAGPRLTAQLVEAELLDELFLTLSPILAGRRAGDGRMGLLEGAHLLPGLAPRPTLRSLRLHGSHLMLRYAL